MENLTIEHIISFVEIHRYTGYLVLFFAMLLEGETVLILAGILAHLEAFDPGDVLWIAFAGVVLGNMFWYYLGTLLGQKGFAQGVIAHAERAIHYFLPRFHERPFKSIFFSKFIYGANRATVFMSGVLKVDFSLFMRAEVFASVFWVALYAGLGFFFGFIAIQMTHHATRFALLVVLFVVGFVLLQRFGARHYESYKRNKEGRNA